MSFANRSLARLGCLALPLALGLLAGCSSSTEAPAPFADDRVAQLAQRLESDTGVPWNVESDERGNPTVLSPLGKVPASITAGNSRAEGTKSFVARYAAALGDAHLSDTLEADVDVADDASLLPPETSPIHHVRLSQRIPGSNVKVYGADITAHYDSDGSLLLVAANATSGVDTLSPIPTLTAEDAYTRALGAMTKVAEDASARQHGEPELVVHRDLDGHGRLAYRVSLELVGYDRIAPAVFVDATSGEILESNETCAHAAAKVNAKNAYSYLPDWVHRPAGRGTTSLIEIETEEPSLSGPTNRLVRAGSASQTRIETDTAILFDTNASWRLPILSSDPTTFDAFSADRTNSNGSAVNVHENLAITDAYFRRMGLRSWDGKGSTVTAGVRANMKKGSGFVPLTAYFNDVVYFEGGLVQDGALKRLPYGIALDVVAHEFSHGIAAHHAHLVHIGESGALDEAISDVLGAGVEHWANLGSSPLRIAEDVYSFGVGATPQSSRAALRDIANPRSLPPEADVPVGFEAKVPVTYTGRWPTSSAVDDGYTHDNSHIATYAYALMAHGGVHESTGVRIAPSAALGWDRGQMLWLVTVQHGLSGARTSFKDFARVQSALAKGAGYLAPVVCAWHAVSVFSAAEVRSYGVTCSVGPETLDSCGGRLDGHYCSDLSPGASIYCRNGSIAFGLQCTKGGRCKKSSPTASPATVDASGNLVCE